MIGVPEASAMVQNGTYVRVSNGVATVAEGTVVAYSVVPMLLVAEGHRQGWWNVNMTFTEVERPPTAPSDSQDEPRRRDDADTFGPHRVERDEKGAFCFHCQADWPCVVVEAYRLGRADVAQLTAERDEAQALLRLAPHHQQQVETLKYELVQARAEAVRLAAERDEARADAAEFARHTSVMFQDCLDHRLMVRAMRPVVEALAALVGLKDGPRGPDYEQRKPLAWQTARDRLAAVDQMAPSTPPSTPESDGQGEVTVTDAVEAPGGAERLGTMRARSCPNCRSIGAPRIIPGVPNMSCMDVWHDHA